MLSATGIYVSYVNPIVTFYGKFTGTHISVMATWSLQTLRLDVQVNDFEPNEMIFILVG